MKLWIARDKEGELRLWRGRPTKGLDGHFHGEGLRGLFWVCLLPEITFENSPQEVEIRLCNTDFDCIIEENKDVFRRIKENGD